MNRLESVTQSEESGPHSRFDELAGQLSNVGRDFYARGWALGTSGNFSAVCGRDPLRLAITSSGMDKSRLAPEHILRIDDEGKAAEGPGRPSAETALHLMLARARGAGAVFHTHSVWGSIVSEEHARTGGLYIEGFEMLKGLAGVSTHEHREWLPVFENSQDMATLSVAVERTLEEHPFAHGFLLRRHGLYTWGRDVDEAKRHVEILEFLLEVSGRTAPPAGAL